MALAVSITEKCISIYSNGEFYQVDSTHGNFNPLLQELRKQPRDESKIMELADVPTYIKGVTKGRVEIGAEGVLFKGQPVGGYMVDRLLAMVNNGVEIESWAAFMDNLMDNPNPDVREDLYKWMEAGKMPISPDGCLLGFKKVRVDYTDVHTGRFSNVPGAVLSMERSLCDPSRNNTCSTGFHFCSVGYLSHFSGAKVMVVKINPRDVTAIPTDYNNHKARCCQYTVEAELSSEAQARHKVWEKNVVDLANPQELPKELLASPRMKSPKEIEVEKERTDGPAPAKDSPTPPAKPKSKAKGGKSKKATTGAPVSADNAVPATAQQPQPQSAKQAKTPLSVQQIKDLIAQHGSVRKAAEAAGIARSTFSGWVKKLGVQ